MTVTPAPPFADIEDVLMEYLSALGPTDTVAPEDNVAVGIQINRVGGEDDGITDYPRVQITTYAPTYTQVKTLAENVRQYMLVLGGEEVVVDGKRVVVDFCQTDVPPEGMFYDNPDRDRKIAYYRLGLMRPRTT